MIVSTPGRSLQRCDSQPAIDLPPAGTLPEVVIETLESVADERQGHFGRLFDLRGARAPVLCCLRLEQSGIIRLVNLIGGEVRRVNVGREPGLKGSADTAQAVKVDAPEEVVSLDLVSASAAETVLGVADET